MRLRTSLVPVLVAVFCTLSLPVPPGCLAAGPSEAKFDFGSGFTFLDDNRMYTSTGADIQVEGATVFPVNGDLSCLFSGDDRTFEFQYDSSAQVKMYICLPGVLKITKIRFYPLGNSTETSKLCNFYFNLGHDYLVKYYGGTELNPINTSSVSKPDQYLEYNFTDMMADRFNIYLLPYYKANPIAQYYFNEIEIFIDPSWSPYTGAEMGLNATINAINDSLSASMASLNFSLSALNTSLNAGVDALGSTIATLTASFEAAVLSINASIDALNGTFTAALGDLGALIDALNATFSANLQALWSSYLDNLTSTRELIASNFADLSAYTNETRDGLLADLGALGSELGALNASYLENRSLLSAYMAFVNASLDLLNARLTLLSDAEDADINAVSADLDELRNYTVRANGILNDLMNMTDSDLNAQDDQLETSIIDLWNMTGNLSDRANAIEARAASDSRNQTMALDAQVAQLQALLDRLQEESRSNTTKMENEISDARRQAQGDVGLAAVLVFLAGVSVTLLAVRAGGRGRKRAGRAEGAMPHDEEE